MSKLTDSAAGGAMSARRPPRSTPRKGPRRQQPGEAQAPRLKGVKVGEAKRDAPRSKPIGRPPAARARHPAPSYPRSRQLPPDAFAKLTIDDLAHLFEAFNGRGRVVSAAGAGVRP